MCVQVHAMMLIQIEFKFLSIPHPLMHRSGLVRNPVAMYGVQDKQYRSSIFDFSMHLSGLVPCVR